MESWTSAVLASKGCVCPVGQLQDRRLVLTEPHELPRDKEVRWAALGQEKHTPACKTLFPGFQQASAGALSDSPSPAPDVRGPHVWSGASRQTNLAKAQLSQQVCCRHFGQALERCQPIWPQLFITSQQKCVRCSATHVECGVGVVLLWAHGSITCSPGAPFKINDVVGNCTSKHDSKELGHDTTGRTKDRSHLLRRCSNSADIRGMRSSSPLWWNHTTEES